MLEEERSRVDKIVSDTDIDQLLCEDHMEDKPRDNMFGYPTRPVYRELGNMLNIWRETK